MLRFEQAIAQTEDLLDQQRRGEISTAQLAERIAELITTSNGARGFFVVWLTGDSALADTVPPEVLSALRTAPDQVAELLTKNLAMSTAMAYTHRANGDSASAAGSEQVSRRTQALITHINLPALAEQLALLKASLDHSDGHYSAFLRRWGYGSAQLKAIREILVTLRDIPKLKNGDF